MPASDIGIDLGTNNCVVCATGKGIVLREPTVVVYDRDLQKIKAIGEEAKQIEMHPVGNIEVIHPIRQGTIVNYDVLEKLLKNFILKTLGRRVFRKPRISICVPAGIKEIEKKAMEEATYQAGARSVHLVEAPIAAALGAGIDISRPCGNLLVDIGGGTTDVAVLSISGITVSQSIKVAGNSFNQAIINYVRKTHSLFIDEQQAENIKIRIGTAVEEAETRTMDVKGRNIITGLPKVIHLTSEEVRVALRDPVGEILDCIHNVLERTPPELAADIVDRGIVLTGGGSLLGGMERAVEEKTGINTMTAQDPALVNAIGMGLYAEIYEKLE